MKINKQIPNEILNAATVILSQFVPGLSAEALLKALETYNPEDKEKDSSPQNPCSENPITSQEEEKPDASLTTIEFYMDNGEIISYSHLKINLNKTNKNN